MDTICTYQGNRDEILIAYLYDDLDPVVRAGFDAHLTGCVACRRELDELGIVRRQLEAWAPPEPAARALSDPAGRALSDQRFSGGRDMVRRAGWWRPAGWWPKLGDMPAWAQVATAIFFLGVSAGVANLDIRYDNNGLTIGTGWLDSSAATDQAASAYSRGNTSGPAGRVGASDQAAPWRADLVALEQQLRSEMRAAGGQGAARTAADTESMLRRVRTLIEESEQRQQRELALRVAEVGSEARAQRVADLRNIDRNLNVIQSNTGVDMMRLYRFTNDLAVRVSQGR